MPQRVGLLPRRPNSAERSHGRRGPSVLGHTDVQLLHHFKIPVPAGGEKRSRRGILQRKRSPALR